MFINPLIIIIRSFSPYSFDESRKKLNFLFFDFFLHCERRKNQSLMKWKKKFTSKLVSFREKNLFVQMVWMWTYTHRVHSRHSQSKESSDDDEEEEEEVVENTEEYTIKSNQQTIDKKERRKNKKKKYTSNKMCSDHSLTLCFILFHWPSIQYTQCVVCMFFPLLFASSFCCYFSFGILFGVFFPL